ncbi:MAG: N-acetyltransferase family protein [Alphaproteobacteria bacterium]
MPQPQIRPAGPADDDALWALLEPVLRAGETYALPTDWSRDEALAFWRRPAHAVFVAELPDGVAGTYYLTANKLGPGDHVANCGYVTAGWAEGRGVARAMGRHSLEAARERGFRAMQFNAVVATNVRAIRAWESLGFTVVGRLPGAFRHPRRGFVDALVMWRDLTR